MVCLQPIGVIKRGLVRKTKQLQMPTACVHSLSLKLPVHCFPYHTIVQIQYSFIISISSFLGFDHEWLLRYFQKRVYEKAVVIYRGSYNNNEVYYHLSHGVVT